MMPISGLHQNYFRPYYTNIGRYLRTDPIGLSGGINLYAYASDNPTDFIDPFGLRSLTLNEEDALRRFFGSSLDYESIDLEISFHGGAWSPYGDNISLPESYFIGSQECGELDLSNRGVYRDFVHEALHVWQRQRGVNVTPAAIPLQVARWFSRNRYNPYSFTYHSNPEIMLQEFINGNVEQQASIFDTYVYTELSNEPTHAYSHVSWYVRYDNYNTGRIGR